MPINRFAEFEAAGKSKSAPGANSSKSSISRPSTSLTQDIEMGVIESGGSEFFSQVESIRHSIRRIHMNMQEIERCHRQALTSLYAEEAAKTSKEIEDLTVDTSRVAEEVREKLKRLGKENEELNRSEQGSANLRIRSTQVGQLSKKFMDVMHSYQDMQVTYKAKYRQQLQRQFKIVRPEATNEELEGIVEAEGGVLMSQQIFTVVSSAEAKRLLEEMQDRHNDIMVLEKSILDLHQLFMDMAMLVEQQGDMVNSIEDQVDAAKEYTGKAVIELGQAVDYQKRARKKKWCLLIFIIILVIVGAFLIWFFLGGGKETMNKKS